MDWNDFAKRLTIELMRLPVQAFLIVQGTGGLPYVQALRSRDALEAEAVGSAFLPRPLAPRQERRLTVIGWEPPEDPAAQNWWSHVPLVERSGRTVPDQAERCAALAGRMVAAFRDVYGVGSPLDLVHQASYSDGGPLALPGLGIPRAALEGEEAAPGFEGGLPPAGYEASAASGAAAGRLEAALAAAREHGDQNAYLGLLARTVLYLPSPTDPTYDDGDGHQFATARFGDDTFVLAFTSPEAMGRSLRGQAVHHRRAFLEELVRQWPHPEWQLAINPGLPSAAYLDATALPPAPTAPRPVPQPQPQPQPQPPMPQKPPEPSREPAAEPLGRDNGHPTPHKPEQAPPERPQPPQQRPPRVSAPEHAPGRPEGPETRPAAPPEIAVMQKVIRPEHVAHYLEGGYDLVAGYVHRLQDVRDLNTPAKLVRGLGLVYDGTPFRPVDDSVHVIRWPAITPALFRKPLGGIDEWSMGLVPGGWVIEKAPFPGSGYAPGEGPAIPEFKIDSQRLPHGAEMYRIERSGRETLLGGYDADLRRWLLRPGVSPPGAARPVPAARRAEADPATGTGRPAAGSAPVAEKAPGVRDGGWT
nr:hypothetical protein GCM10010200_013790 [Actinomadura rugatobispora]